MRTSDAWKTVWSRFYHPQTHQFFTKEPSRLPSAERVKRLDPNDCGYGTGMDDCPLFGGILLVAICDQYDVTHDDSLKADALSVFKGLRLCATAHGVPGFVARGVCPEDGKSIYITSSRDQYTHLVHGFWRYFHSPLCDEDARQAIRTILQAVADRMTRNVTPENNYDFLRADGSQDPRGICRMLDVRTHEAARLPMFYAAAWDVGRNEEHYRLYRKHLPQAIQQSLELPDLPRTEIARWIPPYAVLQMQCSLEVLYDLERDPAVKSQTEEAMLQVAEFAAEKRALTARRRNPSAREIAETALAQLTFGGLPLTEQQAKELAGAIMNAEYAIDPGAAYCLLGAYWKARVRGYFQP
ncbi:MAG: hypothetical protein HQ581_02850 [Planctomycetes bacterium]|nr:hypothetical protein [Planctomycetota bacterium]